MTHAGVTIQPTPTEAFAVEFVLDPADAKTFDGVAADNYQRQVAVVMLGRVQSAPTINITHFNGRGDITGLSAIDAARVNAALRG